ncbi:DUF1648 domain-containing protein [Sulfobacillus thermosulfidooxidans]|uniref:DUF1648 domain-containing protein n=1 Tax=Sulfobacillus thermosulfidooxidans TaxID=28034 RepID=UPI0006B41E48|nr:DUF1648 domain-containing protein [Sulfobacillus thermosulfidooxidans]
MNFRLTYAEALRVTGPWIFLPALIIFAMAAISAILYWRHGSSYKNAKSITVFLVVFGLVMVIFGLSLSLSTQGTGWSLQRGILTVDTGVGTVKVAASDVHTLWVNHHGSYALEERIIGTSTGSYHAGRFVLANGRSAWVFEYGDFPVLVILSPTETILLSSPGISKLPYALKTTNHIPLTAVAIQPSNPYGMILIIMVMIVAVAIQLLISRHYAPYLPERVATHFGLNGQPNGYASKRVALWLGPLISVIVAIPLLMISVLQPSFGSPLITPFSLTELVLVLIFWWMFHMNRKQA